MAQSRNDASNAAGRLVPAGLAFHNLRSAARRVAGGWPRSVGATSVIAHIRIKELWNNPPVRLMDANNGLGAEAAAYVHDPHIDPQLARAGKAAHTSFEVPTVPACS